jgi:acyl-CoA thioesterase-1
MREIVIVAFGDSLTAGYGLSSSDAFPVRLELALRQAGKRVRVINSGVSGDTTAGGRARLAWVLAEKPDAAIVELGANDAMRGIDPEEASRNLSAILSELKQRNVRVLLAGMLAPPNLGNQYTEAFDTIFPDLAAAHDVMLYPFFLDGVAAEPALNQQDGIHPNAMGVAVIVDRILPYVSRLIDAM